MAIDSNKKKDLQLGINHSTANGQLRKIILFDLLQRFNLNTCFQCGEKIELVDDLSIEHKVPWLDSENPRELFFDLDNIAFSHLSCNIGAARHKEIHGQGRYYKGCRYDICKTGHAENNRNWRQRKLGANPVLTADKA